MIYVKTTGLRTVVALPPQIITIPNGGTTGNPSDPTDPNSYSGIQILADRRRGIYPREIINCYVQNVGNNNIYFTVGVLGCDNVGNYHGYLAPGQQLDCSVHRLSVWGYCTGGTSTVAILQLNNNDAIDDAKYTDGGEPV